MKNKNLIILIISVMLITSCSDTGKEIGRCDLTEKVKQLVPYKLEQVICFTDNIGQVANITVTKNEQALVRSRPPGEAYDYITYRRKFVELRSETNDFIMTCLITIYGCLSNTDGAWLEISINNNKKTYTSSLWMFHLKSDIEGVFLTDSSTSFHESIEISNKIYYDVVEQKKTSTKYDGKGGEYELPIQLFYNKNLGVLQVNIDDESIFTINQ